MSHAIVVAVEARALALSEPLAADRHPAAVYLARLAPGSRRTMRQALDTVAGLLSGSVCDALSLDWGRVRYSHTAAIRARLAERLAPATVNKTLAALRGVLKEAWRLGLLAAEDYQRAADVPGVRASRLPRGRALPPGEIAALLRACGEDPTAGGLRDGALLAACYGAGLRRAEVVGLDVADYDAEAGSLRVRGKGDKERIAYLGAGASAALADWLAVRGSAPGPLFVPINKAGVLRLRRLTPQAVLGVVLKRGEQAGVAAFSPHDLRRSFVSDLLEAGADIAAVQQLAGHANIQTTARYDRRGEVAKRRAAGLLHVPYMARRPLSVERHAD